MSDRYESGLVFPKQESSIAISHFCSSFHYDPMLSPVIMHLKTKLGSRIDNDTLDLEAVTAVYAVVPTPGAMYLTMRGCQLPILRLQFGDDLFTS